MNIEKIIAAIDAACFHSKEKSKQFGEVFTPWKLINEMCDALAKEDFSNPTLKFLDPCTGRGNMPAVIVQRLMIGLKELYPDERVRYRHIMEKQIYMGELQRENAMAIDRIFNPDKTLQLNLYVGDALKMPEDFFDLPFRERINKYPRNYVWW